MTLTRRFQSSIALIAGALSSCADPHHDHHHEPAPHRSADAQPRSIEYDWMSIADWYRAHADDVEVAHAGEAELVFAGDSITQGWQGAPSWERAFGDYRPANFGIGGDKTENLLWRLQNGAVGRLQPKAVVLLIGVNNFGHNDDPVDAVFAGIEANVRTLNTAFPEAKVLALGVLPYGQSADDPNRKRVIELNAKLSALANEQVSVLDVGHAMLEADGSISPEIMADFLHPTHAGYERLTDAILPTLRSWLD